MSHKLVYLVWAADGCDRVPRSYPHPHDHDEYFLKTDYRQERFAASSSLGSISR